MPDRAGDVTTKQPLHVGEVLADYDGELFSCGVLDHDDSRREAAARAILTGDYEVADWYSWREREDECVAAIAPILRPITLREHTTEPFHEHDDECGTPEALARFEEGDESGLICGQEERCCGCEEIGWWCSEGDGPPMPFFDITRQKIDAALEPIYLAWMEAQDAE